MKQRLLSTILAFVMIMGLFPLTASADSLGQNIVFLDADTMEAINPYGSIDNLNLAFQRPDGTTFQCEGRRLESDWEVYFDTFSYFTSAGLYTLKSYPIPRGYDVVEVYSEDWDGYDSSGNLKTKKVINGFMVSEITIWSDTSYSISSLSNTINILVRKGNDSTKPTTSDFEVNFAGVVWKDKYFSQSPLNYDGNIHQLATIAAKLSSDAYSPDDIQDSLYTLGFSKNGVVNIDMHHYNNQGKSDAGYPDIVGYSFANKKVIIDGKSFNLIAVVVRGTPETGEWYSNFDIGYGDVPNGFKKAEQELYDELSKYMKNEGFTNPENNKFLITGHSRGAAVANLLAARLDFSQSFCLRENLFAYTFATPNAIKKANIKNAAIYNNIYNFVNAEDFVPYLPLSMKGWDFWKYGRTYVFPHSNVTGTSNALQNTFKEKFYSLTSKKYVGFNEAYSTQNVINIMYNLAKNVDEYYTKTHFSGVGASITSKEYFNIVAQVKAGQGAAAIGMLLNCVGAYNSLTNYFLDGLSADARVGESHERRLYLAWMQTIADLNAISSLKTNVTGYYARIACPVNVEVYNSRGVLVGKVVDNVVDESISGGVGIFVDAYGDTKNIYMPDGDTYTLKLTATDSGAMTYTITEYELVDGASGTGKVFESVPLTKGKNMNSEVANDQNIKLCVTDSSGKVIEEIEGKAISGNADTLDSASDWAREGIRSAIEKGFVPTELQSNYMNIITRAEFCRMAVKWVEYATGKGIDTVLAEKGVSRNSNAFTDTSDADILAAYALGITNGTGNNKFDPDGQFTREQAATMIMNSCKAIGADISNPVDSGFADLNIASNWAMDGINFVRTNGIMQGTGSNNFSPKATYTREQSILTFDNINPASLPKASTSAPTQPTNSKLGPKPETAPTGSVTIKYSASGGEGAPSNHDGEIKVTWYEMPDYWQPDVIITFTLSDVVPVQEGYTFLGWSPNNIDLFSPGESGSWNLGSNVDYNGELSLWFTAQWKEH